MKHIERHRYSDKDSEFINLFAPNITTIEKIEKYFRPSLRMKIIRRVKRWTRTNVE